MCGSIMTYFLQVVSNGLITGGVYALAALGFALVFGALRVVNLAHGATCVLGGYVGYFTTVMMGGTSWASLVITLVMGGLFGAILERLAFRPFRDVRSLQPMVSSLACAMIVENLLAVAFGHDAKNIQASKTMRLNFFGATITAVQLYILIVCVVLVTLLYLFLHRTALGRQIIAASDDADASASWGIDVDRIKLVTCVIGSMLAAGAGYLIASDLGIDPYMGTELVFAAFTASLLFGIGSLPGAVAGGFFLGLLQHLVAAFISTRYRSAYTFVVLIILLAWRPRGLLNWSSTRRTDA